MPEKGPPNLGFRALLIRRVSWVYGAVTISVARKIFFDAHGDMLDSTLKFP